MGLSNARQRPCKLTRSPGAHHNRALVMAPSSLYLVTGGAGFIGSHVVERLLSQGHHVRVLDNFSTGSRANLDFAKGDRRLEIIRGDLKSLAVVERAVRGVAAVFHQAAMRSVPRSIADPLGANASNVTGTLHVLVAAAQQRKKPRVVYASSSSVYGERPDLPKREEQPAVPISPYAATKVAGELYASVWSRLFGVETVGLRYFNVFGPRQDPKSEYAAVIPRFILWGRQGKPLQVHGDGTQSRDFTFIADAIEANLRAWKRAAPQTVYNVGGGSQVELLDAIRILERALGLQAVLRFEPRPPGDPLRTRADAGRIERDLGFRPATPIQQGLEAEAEWARELGLGARA